MFQNKVTNVYKSGRKCKFQMCENHVGNVEQSRHKCSSGSSPTKQKTKRGRRKRKNDKTKRKKKQHDSARRLAACTPPHPNEGDKALMVCKFVDTNA